MLYRAREEGVVGLGYVGLPLAVAFAEVGLRVVGIKKDSEKVAVLDTYDSYVEDVSAERLQPLVASLRVGALVALESITYPRTTREVLLPIIEEELKNGDSLRGDAYQVGREFYLAFAPERITPSNRRYTIHNIPKNVGRITSGCTRRAAELYSTEIEEVHSLSFSESVELAKLLENIFRGVSIALVNELALLCDRMIVDVWEVIEAAKTRPFGFMPIYAGLEAWPKSPELTV